MIAVRDNGIGIPAEMMPRMFTLFAQASPALERSDPARSRFACWWPTTIATGAAWQPDPGAEGG
ncbi:MAG: hypothetical protein ACRETZ_03720 [Steroidobacteraceae bacterium]